MAVDQLRQNLNFFRSDMLSSGNIDVNNNLIHAGNNLYGNTNLATSLAGAGVYPANESPILPYYNVNNVAGVGKLSPAVKDDSGVTFNNSLVPSAPVSRKRPRESPVLTSPMISGADLNSLVTVTPMNSVNRKYSTGLLSFLGEDFSLQFMQQQSEFDRFISQHMEKMKMEIEERKKQEIRRTMAIIEGSIAKKLREKDDEIQKIGKINSALEERVKSLHIENQIWRDLAQTNEATANALRTNLEQVLEQVRGGKNVENGELTDDAVSCCGSSGENEEEVKNEVVEEGQGWIYRGKNPTTGDGENGSGGKRMCRKCGQGESRVLLLPCRHLCLCTSCGPAVNTCPICNSPKNASVHVNLS